MDAQRPSVANSPLVVIVGPTASGKTSLAVNLAKKYNGEIICADSRTIYKYMDIGTAKPSSVERAEVPHWGLDLVEPGERFTVSDFKEYAVKKAREIRSRGHTPFLVGGTGLYIDAVVFDYKFSGDYDAVLREKFEKMPLDELHEYCIKNNIVLPENNKNRRYVIRAIEQKSIHNKRSRAPIANTIIVGIATNSDDLRERIEKRTEQLFKNGVVDEAIRLGEKYGWNSEAFTGNIYRIVSLYLSGEMKEDEMKEKFMILDRQLVKKQLTWFRRNPYIEWLNLRDAEDYLSERLAKQ